MSSVPEVGTAPHFEDRFGCWASKCHVQVHHEKNASLVDMFEDGDFAYVPTTTVAIVLAESEAEEDELVAHLLDASGGELAEEAVLSLRRSQQAPMGELRPTKQV